jgi:hypothetical protein
MAVAAGDRASRVKPAWLFQQDAYQQLLGQVALEIDQFSPPHRPGHQRRAA